MGYSFFHYEQPNQTRRMFYCGCGYWCALRTAGAGVGYRHEPSREQPDGGDRRTTNLRRNVPDVPRRRRRRRCRPRRSRAEHNGVEARRWRRRPLSHDTPGSAGHPDAAVPRGFATSRCGSSSAISGQLQNRGVSPDAARVRIWSPKAMSPRAKRSSFGKAACAALSRGQRTRRRHRSRFVQCRPADVGGDPPENRRPNDPLPPTAGARGGGGGRGAPPPVTLVARMPDGREIRGVRRNEDTLAADGRRSPGSSTCSTS